MNYKKAFFGVLAIPVIIGVVVFVVNYINAYKDLNDTIVYEVNLEEEYPEAWAELGESLKILELGGNDFFCDNNATYYFSSDFEEVFRKMHGGYYKDTSDEQIHAILLDKIDRMTTFCLNAGEVYEKLKPTDGVTIETYLVEIDAKIAESKTISAGMGYKVGDALDGNTDRIYQGGDRWIDSNNVVWIPSITEEGHVVFNAETSQVADNTQSNNSSSTNKNNSNSSTNNNSKYISERNGCKEGDTITTSTGVQLTYLGKDIWQDSSGETYKARDNGNNEIKFYSKSPWGVSSATDEDGYILPGSMTQEEIEKNEFDPSGYAIGTAGWHAYWDGKTVKEYNEQGGFHSLYYIIKEGEGNRLPTTKDYPDDYVIGSYAILEENFYGEDQHLYGEY